MDQKEIQKQLERLAKGKPVSDNKIRFKTYDAERVLIRGLAHFIGEGAQWLPEYGQIADWLSDNKGKGLFCMGNCGRGKSVITQQILPLVFQHWHGLIQNSFTALELCEDYDKIVQYKIICIDDVGTEPDAKKYGEAHNYFNELVNECERKDKLLIVSTNLSKQELKERYGERTTDRLRSLTTQVVFKGKSLRQD